MPHKAQHLDAKAIYLALTDPNTFATTIQAVLLTAYGPEIFDLDPVEIYLRLEDDFGVQPIEEVENRIQAITTATATDLFFEDPHAFEAICETLTNGDPGLEVMEHLTLGEVLWGLYEVELNHGPGKLSPQVSSMIQGVIEAEAGDPEAPEHADNSYTYLHDYLAAQREALRQQLTAVGFKDAQLPPVKPHSL